jgi:hypothetical protein
MNRSLVVYRIVHPLVIARPGAELVQNKRAGEPGSTPGRRDHCFAPVFMLIRVQEPQRSTRRIGRWSDDNQAFAADLEELPFGADQHRSFIYMTRIYVPSCRGLGALYDSLEMS